MTTIIYVIVYPVTPFINVYILLLQQHHTAGAPVAKINYSDKILYSYLYYKINNSTVTHSSSLSVNDAMPNNICAHSVMHVSWLGRIYYLDGLRLLILMWIRKFQCHLDCIPLHNDGWFLCNDCHSSHWQSVAKTFFILWCSEFGGKEAVYSKTDYFIPFFSHVIKYAYIIWLAL